MSPAWGFFFALLFVALIIGIPIGLVIWLKRMKKLKQQILDDVKGGENVEKEKESSQEGRVDSGATTGEGEQGIPGDSKYNSTLEGRGSVSVLPSKQPNTSKRQSKKDWPSFD